MRAAFSCTDEKQLLLKYKMLQAQINPHFLYNTLNSIHWMVRAGRNEEAADMTVALGEILRAALSSKQFFTMGEEINMLNKYGGIIANADPGTYLIDMTTTSPRLAVRIYEEAKNAGLHALDAPVTGGDKGAKDGTLTILAGGDREDFDACLSILQAMGKNIDYEGKAGNGQHTNMCNQIAVAGALAGACEAGLCQECGAGCGHNAKVHFHRSRQQCADEQCGFKGVAGRLSAWILHQTFYQGYEPGR